MQGFSAWPRSGASIRDHRRFAFFSGAARALSRGGRPTVPLGGHSAPGPDFHGARPTGESARPSTSRRRPLGDPSARKPPGADAGERLVEPTRRPFSTSPRGEPCPGGDRAPAAEAPSLGLWVARGDEVWFTSGARPSRATATWPSTPWAGRRPGPRATTGRQLVPTASPSRDRPTAPADLEPEGERRGCLLAPNAPGPFGFQEGERARGGRRPSSCLARGGQQRRPACSRAGGPGRGPAWRPPRTGCSGTGR